jgi:hypothetical protein
MDYCFANSFYQPSFIRTNVLELSAFFRS